MLQFRESAVKKRERIHNHFLSLSVCLDKHSCSDHQETWCHPGQRSMVDQYLTFHTNCAFTPPLVLQRVLSGIVIPVKPTLPHSCVLHRQWRTSSRHGNTAALFHPCPNLGIPSPKGIIGTSSPESLQSIRGAAHHHLLKGLFGTG